MVIACAQGKTSFASVHTDKIVQTKEGQNFGITHFSSEKPHEAGGPMNARNAGVLMIATTMAIAPLITGVAPAFAQGGEEAIFFFLGDPPDCPNASFAGGSSPLIGCAVVTQILATGTPMNGGTPLGCDACTFNFETGSLTGSNSTQWFFGPGGIGSVTMSGSIQDMAGDLEPPPGLILTGTLSPGTVTEDRSTATFSASFIGTLSDEGLEELNEFYGITSTVYSNSLTLSFIFSVPVTGGDPFTSTNSGFSGTIEAVPVGVPEPPAAALLGSALLMGAVLLMRRRRGPAQPDRV